MIKNGLTIEGNKLVDFNCEHRKYLESQGLDYDLLLPPDIEYIDGDYAFNCPEMRYNTVVFTNNLKEMPDMICDGFEKFIMTDYKTGEVLFVTDKFHGIDGECDGTPGEYYYSFADWYSFDPEGAIRIMQENPEDILKEM